MTHDRSIAIRFTNRKTKIRVLQNSRKLKKVTDPTSRTAQKVPNEPTIYINFEKHDSKQSQTIK